MPTQRFPNYYASPDRFTRHNFERVLTMSAIAELGDKLAGLTIAQAVELKDYLKETP